MKAKTLFIVAIALYLAAGAKAGEYLRFQNQWNIIYTNSVSFDLSQTTGFTNTQGTAVSQLHTFQMFYNVAGTNGGATVAVDRTLDGVNWYNFTNYTWSATTTNVEFVTQGKWAQYRFRETDLATNGSLVFNYMAQ